MNQAIINAIKELLPAYKNATVKRDAQNLRYLIGISQWRQGTDGMR